LQVELAVAAVMVAVVELVGLELGHAFLFVLGQLFVQQLVVQVQLLQEVMQVDQLVVLVEIVFYLVEELQQLLLLVVEVVDLGIQIDVELTEDLLADQV
tara:strand:+ start:141 stop:437 length:297 start_codon:yes stop_codon:yes gene_type:complete